MNIYMEAVEANDAAVVACLKAAKANRRNKDTARKFESAAQLHADAAAKFLALALAENL
jgi:hypothetical protein